MLNIIQHVTTCTKLQTRKVTKQDGRIQDIVWLDQPKQDGRIQDIVWLDKPIEPTLMLVLHRANRYLVTVNISPYSITDISDTDEV